MTKYWIILIIKINRFVVGNINNDICSQCNVLHARSRFPTIINSRVSWQRNKKPKVMTSTCFDRQQETCILPSEHFLFCSKHPIEWVPLPMQMSETSAFAALAASQQSRISFYLFLLSISWCIFLTLCFCIFKPIELKKKLN